jgi:heme A synthase
MFSLLINLVFLVVIFAVFWWILGMVPVPPQLRWLVNVVFGLILLLCLMGVFGFVPGFPHYR